MNKIEKLLRKITASDKEVLVQSIQELIHNPHIFGVKKLVGTDFYRYRKGSFRIIFHIENNKAIVDNISIRNEKTYKKL
jgi:mRNA-degrading endonuclease RelE of RelBE toxin-antitoxin system